MDYNSTFLIVFVLIFAFVVGLFFFIFRTFFRNRKRWSVKGTGTVVEAMPVNPVRDALIAHNITFYVVAEYTYEGQMYRERSQNGIYKTPRNGFLEPGETVVIWINPKDPRDFAAEFSRLTVTPWNNHFRIFR